MRAVLFEERYEWLVRRTSVTDRAKEILDVSLAIVLSGLSEAHEEIVFVK